MKIKLNVLCTASFENKIELKDFFKYIAQNIMLFYYNVILL